MAVRVGNSWHLYEIAGGLEPEQRHDDDAEGRLLPPGGDGNTEGSLEVYHDLSADAGEPELAASKVDEFITETFGRPEQRAAPAAPTVLASQQIQAECSEAREVAKFDHGLSYRIFIWIPMVLQIIKLLVVSGSGSLLA
jgi:hypothetical protein